MIALFSTFGQVTKSEMTIDPLTGRSKGFCFLEFNDPSSAEAAMAMDGFELAGRKIKGKQEYALHVIPRILICFLIFEEQYAPIAYFFTQ